MPTNPIKIPAPYVPAHAVAYADVDGSAKMVSTTAPMPVSLTTVTPLTVQVSPVATAALSGTVTGNATVGPFAPVTGRSVMLTLAGTWSGAVSLLRSVDGGVTKTQVTMGGASWATYSGNCCEPVWDESEAAATLYLLITLTAGSVSYRLAQ